MKTHAIGCRVRVNGYLYFVESGEKHGLSDREIVLVPQGDGHMAESTIERSDYAYDHGGKTYRAAVDRAKQLKKEIFPEMN